MTVRVHYPDGGRSWELGINFKFVGCIPQGQGSFARKIFNPFHVRKKNHRLRLSANLVNVCRHVGFHTCKLRVSVFFFFFFFRLMMGFSNGISLPSSWAQLFSRQNETSSTAHVQASPRFEISHQTTKKRKATKTAWRDYIHFVKPLLDVFSPHFSSFFFSQNLTKSTKTGSVWERHCLSLLHGTKKWHWSGKWKQVDPNKPLEDDWNVKQVIYSQIGNRLCRQEICTYWRRWNWVPGA